jgi:hypothetical protein
MVARLAVIGAALIVMGLLHVWNNGTPTMVAGGVLLAVGAVVGVVQHQRGMPISRYRR